MLINHERVRLRTTHKQDMARNTRRPSAKIAKSNTKSTTTAEHPRGYVELVPGEKVKHKKSRTMVEVLYNNYFEEPDAYDEMTWAVQGDGCARLRARHAHQVEAEARTGSPGLGPP